MPAPSSRRISGLAQSDIRRMTRECERLGGINLGQGICDLPTPPPVRDGAVQAVLERRSTYSFAEGCAELRGALARKLLRDNGISYDPAGEIVVTVGSSGAFAATIHALLDPGDGLLLLEPYYGYHLNAAIVAGLRPRFLTLSPPDFALSAEALRAAVTDDTRAVVLCTPSNPSGKMFSEAELQALATVAAERDLLVITDEVYEYIVFDGRRHLAPASIEGLRGRTVSIGSLSKTFSVTGWRLGWAAAPREMAQGINLVNDLFYVCAPTPLQHAAAPGLDGDPAYFRGLATEYQGKRDLCCDALDRAGLRPIVPQGAYYVLADVGHLGYATGREAAMALLEGVGVASVSGACFYQGPLGERLLRFCFAKEDAVLEEACRRIREFRA
jgi:aminotransferase